jgi:hypothetical protein
VHFFFDLRAFSLIYMHFSVFSVIFNLFQIYQAYFKLFARLPWATKRSGKQNVLTLACCISWLSIMGSTAGQTFGW